MLVLQLSYGVRAKPWDQVLKIGLHQTLWLDVSLRWTMILVRLLFLWWTIIDLLSWMFWLRVIGYWVMEIVATSPIRVSALPKSRRSAISPKSKGAHTQSDVKIKHVQKSARTSGKTTVKSAGRPGPPKASSKGRGSQLGVAADGEVEVNRAVLNFRFCPFVSAL